MLLGAVCAMCLPATALASKWGPRSECGYGELEHCYAVSERNVASYGGVLASIDFVDTDYNTYPTVAVREGYVDNEEWISFPADGDEGWIETGQAMGYPYQGSEQASVEIHPFYAEKIYFGSDYNHGKGTYHEELSPEVLPAGGPAFEKPEPYNHYVLYDPERTGLWRIYWGCCEVGSYGGGWPAYLTYQEAGIEAATWSRPYEWGRQEVADSDGGAWTPWEHDTWWNEDKGICLEANEESHAEGNVEWGTNCN
jgi:hypothetical protein